MDSNIKGKLALSDSRAFNSVMMRYNVGAVIPVSTPAIMRENCKIFPAGGCFYRVKIMGDTKFADVMRLEKEIRSDIADGRKKAGLYEKSMSIRFDTEPFLVLEVDPPPGYFLPYEAGEIVKFTAPIGKLFSVDGESLMAYDLNKHYQTLVAAVSGHGKSRLLRNCIVGLSKNCTPKDLQMYFIDFKNDDLAIFSNLPHVKGFAWKQEEASNIIMSLRDEVDKRITKKGKKYNNKHLLVIDEGAELDKSLDDTLSSVMKLGRSLGIHVLLATQYPTSAQIGQKVNNAFTHRFVGRVGSASNAAWACGIPDSGAELLRKPGAFLDIFGGQINRFQTFTMTPEEEGIK